MSAVGDRADEISAKADITPDAVAAIIEQPITPSSGIDLKKFNASLDGDAPPAGLGTALQQGTLKSQEALSKEDDVLRRMLNTPPRQTNETQITVNRVVYYHYRTASWASMSPAALGGPIVLESQPQSYLMARLFLGLRRILELRLLRRGLRSPVSR